MKCKDDIIIYNNEEKKALDAIKELNLQRKLYYKKRNLGMSAQEAFNHCMKLKEKKDKIGNVNITQLSKNSNVSTFTIYKGIKDGKKIDEVVLERQNINLQKQELLELLYNQGMPKDYSSLHDFCIKNGINFDFVFSNLKSGMNFYDAVYAATKKQFDPIHKKYKYKYFGVALNAICFNYGLDYSEVIKFVKKYENYENAIFHILFNQTFQKSPINFGRRTNDMIKLCKIFLETGDISKIENFVSEEIILHFIEFAERYKKISFCMNYYKFLNTLNINTLLCLNVDERVQHVLKILDFTKISFSLNELYYVLDFENGLMSNFVYSMTHDECLWIYKPSSEVLKKIKKQAD